MPNNIIYDNNTIKLFYDKYDELIDKVNSIKFSEYEPTQIEMDSVYETIFKFIKDNRKKIYGGIALDYLFKEKKLVYSVYSGDYDYPDIDFYSTEPMSDLIKLCDILHEKNFKYVRGREALHKETYSLYVNNKLYCNITYVPKNIFNKLPYKIIDDYIIVQSQFLTIDYLRILTDPICSYWRLKDKNCFDRYYELQKLYPFPYSNKSINIDYNNKDDTVNKLLNSIYNYTLNNKNMIHIGLFAYNEFLKKSKIYEKNNKFKVLNVLPYECTSVNYIEDCLEIIKNLKLLLNKEENKEEELIIQENFPFFQYLGYSVSMYYNNKLLCTIYDNNNRCVPYKTIIKTNDNKQDKLYIGTFNYVLLNVIILLMKARVDNNEDSKNLYYTMISHLIEMRKYYFKTNRKTLFDNTIFEDFSLDLAGKTLSAEKERQIIGDLRKKRNKPFLFTYDPVNKKEGENNIKYIFRNTSGNIIKSIKKSKLFSNTDDDIIDIDIIDIIDSVNNDNVNDVNDDNDNNDNDDNDDDNTDKEKKENKEEEEISISV